MKLTLISTIALFLVYYLFAVNPASENYILQQSSFSSGDDPANPPSSANYILQASVIGTISGNEASSTNYNNLPGYYLGELFGEILPPENVTISVVGTQVLLSWDTVSSTNSYKVFSSNDPYTGFTEDLTGTFVDESWSAPATVEKKFYYVKAVN
ncbi:MAG: hypothetical protein K8S23_12410 [Candidatus Cloacimonetes bacterium]|nr:hypothetical protein [Candidatus Cloacimonadota bacterium]